MEMSDKCEICGVPCAPYHTFTADVDVIDVESEGGLTLEIAVTDRESGQPRALCPVCWAHALAQATQLALEVPPDEEEETD
jgi:hypothetical protein